MDNIRNRVRVGIIGGSRAGEAACQAAYEVGRRLAKRGAVIVCGGLGGVMETAARGAREAGGFSIGILPGASPADAGSSIDVAIATGLGYTRNSLVAMNADVLIAIDGEFGTLSEIAYGAIYGRPVVGLGSWEIRNVAPAASPAEAVDLALAAVRKS